MQIPDLLENRHQLISFMMTIRNRQMVQSPHFTLSCGSGQAELIPQQCHVAAPMILGPEAVCGEPSGTRNPPSGPGPLILKWTRTNWGIPGKDAQVQDESRSTAI